MSATGPDLLALLRRDIADLGARIGGIEQMVHEQADRLRRPHSPSTAGTAGVWGDLVERVWLAAPLAARLGFLREILDRTHPLQTALQEAAALEELRRRGPDLENWIGSYPSLFADSFARLDAGGLGEAGGAERLAVATLAEVHEGLGTDLRALGVEWIAPTPGEALAPDMDVVGEEEAAVPAGRVARVRRRGLRWRARVLLPAQVVRASPGSRPGPAVAPRIEPAAVVGPRGPAIPPVRSVPGWLLELRRAHAALPAGTLPPLAPLEELASFGEAPDAVDAPLEALRALSAPALPWLSPGGASAAGGMPPERAAALREARAGLAEWLRGALGVEAITPEEGAAASPGEVEVVGRRRTAHPREDGAVAKLERAGLRRYGDVLFPARVVLYEVGDGR